MVLAVKPFVTGATDQINNQSITYILIMYALETAIITVIGKKIEILC